MKKQVTEMKVATAFWNRLLSGIRKPLVHIRRCTKDPGNQWHSRRWFMKPNVMAKLREVTSTSFLPSTNVVTHVSSTRLHLLVGVICGLETPCIHTTVLVPCRLQTESLSRCLMGVEMIAGHQSDLEMVTPAQLENPSRKLSSKNVIFL